MLRLGEMLLSSTPRPVKSLPIKMLDWMKGALGRKASPLQRLLERSFKDDAEKRELLEALASDTGVKPVELMPLLTGDDSAIEQRVATMFVTRADAGAWAALLATAVDQSDARGAALRTLGRGKSEVLREPVERLLKEPQAERKRACWEVVMALPAEISDSYAERALVEGPPPARLAALQRLLKNRAIEDIRGKVTEAASDREVRVRRMAVEALAKLEGNDVFEVLLDRLGLDDDAEIRKIAGNYLQKYVVSAPREMRPAILGRLLLASDEKVQGALLKALFATGQVSELLLEVLTFCKGVLGEPHTRVMKALAELGDPVLEAGMRLLGNEDPDIRVQCLLLVENFKGPRTVGIVVKLLQDADWWVRIMACETLGRVKDPRSLPYLDKMLPDPDCKWAAIDAIGAIGGESAFATVLSLLKDPSQEVRSAAVNAAKNLTDPRIVGYLEDVAKTDAAPEVRLRAVEAVREVKGGGAAMGTVSSSQLTRPIDKLLAYAREAGASDLHITPGEPPVVRLNGVLTRIKSSVLSAAHVTALLEEVLDSVRKPVLERVGNVDFCYSLPGVGRYRANVFRQARGVSAAFRVIPNMAPTLSELGLPKTAEELSTYHQGVVLVTGPAGAGKSTTLTSLINLLNETRSTHVLSLEDPIEFLHSSKRALVNQREIGRDSKSFASAMRGALREDPDVIVVGDLRDPETIRLALLAAETGHLVIGTMQTTGAVGTLDKLVEAFPADEQHQVRIGLAGSLKLIISQQLAPRADGKSRVAIFEVLKVTPGVRAMIREGKTFQIPNAMQIGRQQGMLTLDAALEELLAAGTLSLETAHALADKKDTFEKKARAEAVPKAPGSDPNAATTGATKESPNPSGADLSAAAAQANAMPAAPRAGVQAAGAAAPKAAAQAAAATAAKPAAAAATAGAAAPKAAAPAATPAAKGAAPPGTKPKGGGA